QHFLKLAALADSNVTPIRHLQALQDAARGRGMTPLPIGVLAYGPRFEQAYRQRAVVKLLRAAIAAEIPGGQPSVFELVVNLLTANTIRQKVSEALIHRADKVIE